MILAKQKYFSQIVEDILKSGKSIRFRAMGESMHPFIKNGEIITVQPINTENLKLGDIVFFRKKRKKTSYIAHRLISKQKDGFIITKGDARREPDEPVSSEQVLGKVISLERRGSVVSFDKIQNKLAGRFISMLSANRIPYLRIYRLARNMLLKPVKPFYYSLQRSKNYRNLARRFIGNIEYGLAKPGDLFLLEQLYSCWSGSSEKNDKESAERLGSNFENNCFRAVAWRKGEIVGVVTVGRKENKKTSKNAWFLFGLVVRPRFRGMGIGEGLVKYAVAEINKRGRGRMLLLVKKSARPAINLYEKLNFFKSNRQKLLEEFDFGQVRENEIVMIKDFSASDFSEVG